MTPRPGATTAPAPPARLGTPPSRGLPYGRVVAVFFASFAFTTAAVLGTWFGVVRTGRPAAEPAPVPAPIVMMAPAPIAAVVVETGDEPVVADASVDEASADEAPADEAPAEPVVEPAAEIAPVTPVRRAPPAPRRPPPTVVVMETPREEVVEPPPPPPVPQAPTVPEAASRHAGTYVGRVQTRPMTVDLAFRPEGKLSATIRVNDGSATEEIKASGTWTLTDNGVTVALVESDAAAPRVWSARVADGEIEGRVVEDPRTTRRFHGSR